ncbi:hypothetical protein AFW95_13755 [Listeria monocytogenes]|nr:hypothetical protein [Listeria monocytogenes]EAD0273282.1 hypothetical protein [Listeria monocytogenes]
MNKYLHFQWPKTNILLWPLTDMALINNLLAAGTPIKTIAARWNVSRTTIYRYLRKDSSQ